MHCLETIYTQSFGLLGEKYQGINDRDNTAQQRALHRNQLRGDLALNASVLAGRYAALQQSRNHCVPPSDHTQQGRDLAREFLTFAMHVAFAEGMTAEDLVAHL